MSKLILGFAGEMASGKGTATKHVVEKYGAASQRFSTMLRDILDRLYLLHVRENMSSLSTILRHNFGEDVLAKVIAKDVERDEHDYIVIDGVRRIEDIKYLRQLPHFRFVYIEADMRKRYDRIVVRRENPDDSKKTFEQFQKEHELETETQIRGLKVNADFVIDNDGNLDGLYAQIDNIINAQNNG